MLNTMAKEDTINHDSLTGQSKSDSFLPAFTIGSLVEGKVIARGRSSLFLDLGPRGTGIIYGREFYEARGTIKNLNIGDTVQAKITELENDNGYVELSLKDATKDIGWQKLKELRDEEKIIKVKITGVNRGGLLTDINGIGAFLPVSQLSPENYPRVIDADKQKILKELQKFIGKTLEVKILNLSAQGNKLILSEKAKKEEALKEILKNYKQGDIVEGKITGIADFGAFIRFPLPKAKLEDESEEKKSGEKDAQKLAENEIEGLIHISELDWQLVQNPSEVVKVGEDVKAQIIDISKNQVFLSLKKLKENPWQEIEKKYKNGDVIKGKVISFSPFGAFVEITPRIRGLCHISEFNSQKTLADGKTLQDSSKMEELLKIGQMYDFQILLIEPKEHRISLKLVK